MSALIETKDLEVRYGAHRALSRVSLEVRHGELLAVVGPNAAGKTTLLRALAALIVPTRGTVTSAVTPAEAAYLAQSEPLPGEWTALEVVELGRVPHLGFWGQRRRADDEAVSEAMLATRTDGIAHRRVRTLSGGQRQRVALARALAQEPRILFLDEPTTHLDLRHQIETFALLRNEATRGVSTVAVVHDLALASLADRCAVLSRGELVALGPPADVLEPALVRDVFDAAVEVMRSRDGRIVIVPLLGDTGAR
jgi:iron complex transport system ATP-binding protein